MKSSRSTATADPAPALGRGVALLRFLEREGVCTLDVLARAHGWPKPSVLRLLRSLALTGLVAQDADSRCWQALMRLVPSQGPDHLLRARAAGVLPALAERLGHTVELYRYSGTGMAMIERAEPEAGGVTVRARVGFLRTFDEAEAVTLVAAACAEAPSRRRRWRWTRTDRGPQRLDLDERAFAALVRSVGRSGPAWDAEVNEWGVRRCAVPVSDAAGRLLGALAAALTGDTAQQDAVGVQLLAAAERIAGPSFPSSQEPAS